jgi:hypothetical protein
LRAWIDEVIAFVLSLTKTPGTIRRGVKGDRCAREARSRVKPRS